MLRPAAAYWLSIIKYAFAPEGVITKLMVLLPDVFVATGCHTTGGLRFVVISRTLVWPIGEVAVNVMVWLAARVAEVNISAGTTVSAADWLVTV